MLKHYTGETMNIWLVQNWNDNIQRCQMFEVPIYQQKYIGQKHVQTNEPVFTVGCVAKITRQVVQQRSTASPEHCSHSHCFVQELLVNNGMTGVLHNSHSPNSTLWLWSSSYTQAGTEVMEISGYKHDWRTVIYYTTKVMNRGH
jgi:hypothetical protein